MDLPALPTGVTTVTGVRLFSDKARTANEKTPPVALMDGVWVVDTLNVPDGRWWATVDAQKGTTPYSYPLRDPIDLPERDDLVISPEALAQSIKIPLPLSDDTRETLTRAILGAQADIFGYLGQPIIPRVYVEHGVYSWGDEWRLTAHGDTPLIKVISTVPEAGEWDTWTVTYLAGLDARTGEEFEPIRRYLFAHAANAPDVVRVWRSTANPEKVIKSSSTEGQSVSYEVPTLGGGGAAGSGAPGALPTLSSLDFWRVAGRRVHQGATHFGERYR